MFKVYIYSAWPLCLSNINQYIWAERADIFADHQQAEEVPHLYGKPGGLSKEQVQVSYDDYWWLSYTFVWMFLTKSREVTSLCRIHSSLCENHFDSPFPACPGPWQKLSNPKDKGTAVVPLPLPPEIRSTNIDTIVSQAVGLKRKPAKALLHDAILAPFSCIDFCRRVVNMVLYQVYLGPVNTLYLL